MNEKDMRSNMWLKIKKIGDAFSTYLLIAMFISIPIALAWFGIDSFTKSQASKATIIAPTLAKTTPAKPEVYLIYNTSGILIGKAVREEKGESIYDRHDQLPR